MRNRELQVPATLLLGGLILSGPLFGADTGSSAGDLAIRGSHTVLLPGEFVPYLNVSIHAKVAGFVDKVEVDRGSVVTDGQLLATMVAPELNAQHAEAEAKGARSGSTARRG